MARFKYEKCDLVKVIGSNAVGCVMGRFTSPDLISKKMYIVKFNNNCVEGTYRESQLAKLENKYTFKKPTDYIGHVFYHPTQLDKERINVEFGHKLFCISASYSNSPRNPIKVTVVDVDANNWRNTTFEINAKYLCWVDDPYGKENHDAFMMAFKKNIIDGVDPNKILPKFKEGQKVILHKILDDSYVTKFIRDIHVAADGRIYYLLTDLKNLENDTWENERNIEAYEEKGDKDMSEEKQPKVKVGQDAIEVDDTEDNESPVEYLYNIGDYVYYHSKLAEVVDRNFMILNTLKRKYYTVRYIYLDSLPVYTTDYDVEYVPEAELSKVEVSKDEDTNTKLSSVDDDYEFENGDIVCYCGDKEISPKSKYYQIINNEKFNNQYYYKIKSYPLGEYAYTDQGNLFSKKCLTYVRDEVAYADKAKLEEEFKFDIGDKVSFRNEVYTVERKLHIGLNNYYKVKNVNTKSSHLATILESELTPYTEPKEEVKVEYKFKVGDTVLYKGSTCRIASKYISCEGKKCYSLTVNNTPTTLFMTEEQLLSNVHEFHPVGDSSLVDTLMKGNFKEIDYTHIIDNRDKTSLHPNLMRRSLMIPGFNIYDLGMGDLTPVFFDDSTTVMVSQPLSNKSKDEILDNRYLALANFINDIGDITRNIVVVDNLQFDRKPTAEEGELNHFDYLSTDIKLMKKIDYIIFAEGWQNSNGCNIEYQMAKTYGIPMYFA